MGSEMCIRDSGKGAWNFLPPFSVSEILWPFDGRLFIKTRGGTSHHSVLRMFFIILYKKLAVHLNPVPYLPLFAALFDEK